MAPVPDAAGQVPGQTCRFCGHVVAAEPCREVEFGCSGAVEAVGPERRYACDGWSGACCNCGTEYALGQI